jgi:protein-S-isoprenylcysteine O-methyltransferase Ste14
MSISIVFIAVCAAWVASEIILAVLLRSGGADKSKDKSSLAYLWITISISITAGVVVASKGIGFILMIFPATTYAGLSFVVLGLILRWVAILTLRRYFTVNVAIRKDHIIVDKGLYGILRHPAYSGSLLSFLGLAIYFANWLVFVIIFLPILCAFLHRIRIEEEVLLKQFGKKYISYSERTKRLVPFVW